MRYTEIDRRIDGLAAKQFGVFSRQQAFDLGASERFVKRRLQEKYWLRPVPAVYMLARSPGTWKRQCKIGELSIDGAAIAGFSAAALHELPGFRPGDHRAAGAGQLVLHPPVRNPAPLRRGGADDGRRDPGHNDPAVAV